MNKTIYYFLHSSCTKPQFHFSSTQIYFISFEIYCESSSETTKDLSTSLLFFTSSHRSFPNQPGDIIIIQFIFNEINVLNSQPIHWSAFVVNMKWLVLLPIIKETDKEIFSSFPWIIFHSRKQGISCIHTKTQYSIHHWLAHECDDNDANNRIACVSVCLPVHKFWWNCEYHKFTKNETFWENFWAM